jgi:hypothetical protein
MTLGDLVNAVQDSCRSDDEVVATLTRMIKSGAVRLGGGLKKARVQVTRRVASRPVAA